MIDNLLFLYWNAVPGRSGPNSSLVLRVLCYCVTCPHDPISNGSDVNKDLGPKAKDLVPEAMDPHQA